MALYRISMLVLLQLGNRFNFAKKSKSVWITVGLSLAAFVAMTVVFIMLFLLFGSVFYIPLSPNLLFFLVVITQILSLISSVANMTASLYGSRDNPILLSMPAEHSEVYYSKLIVAFINEFAKNLFFLLPMMLAYGISAKVGVWFYFAIIFCSLVLPAISILLGALISIPIMYVGKLLKKFPIAYVILVALGCGLALFLISWLLSKLPEPVRLKAMYNAAMIAINKALSVVANNSLFYVWVADVVFLRSAVAEVKTPAGAVLTRARSSIINGGQLWVDSLIWLLLLIAVLFVANLLLSRPLFFRLASHASEEARQKKHVAKETTAKSTYGTFLAKEVKLSLRNIGTLVKEYALIVAMPFILYLANGFINSMLLDKLGKAIAIGLNLILGLMFITASNSASATALSKEGGEFVLLKTAPSNTYLITWAKMTMNVIVSTVFMIISVAITAIMNILPFGTLLQMFSIYVICNAGHILWSMQLDIKNPLMREYASTGGVDDNKNVGKSITYGLILALVVGVLAGVLFFVLPTTWAYVVLLLIAIGFTALRAYLFNLNLTCLFADMEF